MEETELYATASKKIESEKYKELLKLFNSFQSAISNPSVSLDQDILISMLNSDEFPSSPSSENVKNGLKSFLKISNKKKASLGKRQLMRKINSLFSLKDLNTGTLLFYNSFFIFQI